MSQAGQLPGGQIGGKALRNPWPQAGALSSDERLIPICLPLCHHLFRENGSSSLSPAQVSAAGEKSSVKGTEPGGVAAGRPPSHTAPGSWPISSACALAKKEEVTLKARSNGPVWLGQNEL